MHDSAIQRTKGRPLREGPKEVFDFKGKGGIGREGKATILKKHLLRNNDDYGGSFVYFLTEPNPPCPDHYFGPRQAPHVFLVRIRFRFKSLAHGRRDEPAAQSAAGALGGRLGRYRKRMRGMGVGGW